MRKSFFCGYKPDTRYLIAFAITLVCSIICGIVLYKPVTTNIYFRDFASEYVYNAFNFNNSALLFPHLLSDLIYLYALFFIVRFTKLKYLTLIFIYIRGLFLGIYSVLMVAVCSISGVLVLIIVFLPSTIISVALCLVVAEGCKLFNKKYSIAVPAIFAVADLIILALLVNLLFRVIIIIV